ncbi:MAG TPA: hypothetical protein VK891_04650, partial [Euzebyales bacterium]|nr:hypothetical protein [Euzebyales bacterium]
MEDLLQPYGASVDSVFAAGRAIAAHSGDVENLDNRVDLAHLLARQGVAGLLAGPMANAPAPVGVRAHAVRQHTLFAGAALGLFARCVAGYNNQIATLLERWQARTPVDSGAPAEEVDAAQEAEDELRRSLTARQVELEVELDAGADQVIWLLSGGITDEALRVLHDVGGLPIGAEDAFPESDFTSQANPVARWWHLVYMGMVPGHLYTTPAEQTTDAVRNFLGSEPTMATEFAQLLGMDRLAAAERRFLEGLGAYDAESVVAAGPGADNDPGRESLADIADGVGGLREINDRIAGGERVTYGERAYWEGWFSVVDADTLAGLPGHVDEALLTSGMLAAAPRADEAAYAQRLRGGYLSPIADTIMHMSNPVVVHGPSSDRVIGLEDMPEPVRQLATVEIGAVSDDGRRTFDDEVIPGVDQFAGFADLMATSTVRGGERFTVEL